MSEVRFVLISTVPKSSTIATVIFFNAYNALLQNEELSIEKCILFPSVTLFDKQLFIIAHCDCPGFALCETDPLRLQQWKQIEHVIGIPWNMRQASSFEKELTDAVAANDTELLRQFKIIYIYRNPLDQLISSFKHLKRYPPDSELFKTIANPFVDFKDFVFNKNGLNSYIKNFYSHCKVAQTCPNLIDFISYEELCQERAITFKKIINLLDIPFNAAAFDKALAISSISTLQQFEDSNNKSLISELNTRHIRNGGIGVWQEIFTPEMIADIEAAFNKFGLSLEDFQLTPKNVHKNSCSYSPA